MSYIFTLKKGDLCGCDVDLLNSRTIAENLDDCAQCGILTTCPYPQSVATWNKADEEENLKEKAAQCDSFEEFHALNVKRNRLQQPHQTQKFTKFTKPRKNLKEVARNCITFSEFHERVKDE